MVDEKGGQDNLAAALEHRDRISHIYLHGDYLYHSPLENLVAVMHEPFPVLTEFSLKSTVKSVLPKTLLGGSAPRLRTCVLSDFSFSSFPKFILSATHIVSLGLFNFPNSRHISPEMMVRSLATLPNLKSLSLSIIRVESPHSPTLGILPQPPPKRTVFPALTYLYFGVSEYTGDIVARIDTPLLNELILAWDPVFKLSGPRLHPFIDHAQKFRPFNLAILLFRSEMVGLNLGSPTRFTVDFRCEWPALQFSSMTQILSQQLPDLFQVERLWICDSQEYPKPIDALYFMNTPQCLELLHLFGALQSLYVSKGRVPLIAAALRELTNGRVMEVINTYVA